MALWQTATARRRGRWRHRARRRVVAVAGGREGGGRWGFGPLRFRLREPEMGGLRVRPSGGLGRRFAAETVGLFRPAPNPAHHAARQQPPPAKPPSSSCWPAVVCRHAPSSGRPSWAAGAAGCGSSKKKLVSWRDVAWRRRRVLWARRTMLCAIRRTGAHVAPPANTTVQCNGGATANQTPGARYVPHRACVSRAHCRVQSAWLPSISRASSRSKAVSRDQISNSWLNIDGSAVRR